MPASAPFLQASLYTASSSFLTSAMTCGYAAFCRKIVQKQEYRVMLIWMTRISVKSRDTVQLALLHHKKTKQLKKIITLQNNHLKHFSSHTLYFPWRCISIYSTIIYPMYVSEFIWFTVLHKKVTARKGFPRKLYVPFCSLWIIYVFNAINHGAR